MGQDMEGRWISPDTAVAMCRKYADNSREPENVEWWNNIIAGIAAKHTTSFTAENTQWLIDYDAKKRIT